MALILYPLPYADSFITVLDADTVISNYSIQSDQWLALTEQVKEQYLRIAYERLINNTPLLDDTAYVAVDSCLPNANALMAVHDLVYGLSSEINPNTGLVTKEKVEGIEVEYYQGNSTNVNGRVTSPYPESTHACIATYGGTLNTMAGLQQMTLGKS